jgi:hypothetical protein
LAGAVVQDRRGGILEHVTRERREQRMAAGADATQLGIDGAEGAFPCHLFCLDPIEAMIGGLEPGARFDVKETLYEGDRCLLRATWG